MHVFWTKGYDGTSMKDLTSAMGINSPSLYAAFGDKQALYRKTIDAYVNNGACAPLVAFEGEPDIRAAVRLFLIAAAEFATQNPSGARGCYLSSCVVTNATEVDGVAERLQRTVRDTDARLAERFDAEIAQGALPADFPSRERASLMFDLRQGIVFRARTGVNRDTILIGVDHKVASILA